MQKLPLRFRISKPIYRMFFRSGMYKWKGFRVFDPVMLRMKRRFLKDDSLYVLPKHGVIAIDENVEKEDLVLPPDILEHFIEKANYLAVMNHCYCRNFNECQDYPIDLGCLFLGEGAKSIHPDLVRPVTKEEARAHLSKARAAGLIHLTGKFLGDSLYLGANPRDKFFMICSCCPCCCVSLVTPHVHPELMSLLKKLPGVNARINDECIGCGACLEACIYAGIKLDGKRAVITESCRACGRCIEACPSQAIRIDIDDPAYVQKVIADLDPRVDLS